MFSQAEKKSLYFFKFTPTLQILTESDILPFFAACKSACRCLDSYQERGKSGQHRAPYFLTGRISVGDDRKTDRATETNRQSTLSVGKGEKVG